MNTSSLICSILALGLSFILQSVNAKSISGSIEEGLTVHGISMRATYDLNTKKNSDGKLYFRERKRENVIPDQCSDRSLGKDIIERRKKTVVHGNGVHEIYARYKSQQVFKIYHALLRDNDGKEREVAKVLVDNDGYVLGVHSEHHYPEGVTYDRVKATLIKQLGKPRKVKDWGNNIRYVYGLSDKQVKSIGRYANSLSEFSDILTEEYVSDLPRRAAIVYVHDYKPNGTRVNITLIDNPHYLVRKHDEVVEKCLVERKAHYDMLLTKKERAKEKARAEFEL